MVNYLAMKSPPKLFLDYRLWLTLCASAILLLFFYSSRETPYTMQLDLDSISLDEPVEFAQVRPILERRCVVCHGCYDAPCQLDVSSIEGLQRGASKERVYEPKRVTTMQPTRLFIDAKTTSEWRERNFHAVLNEAQQTPENNLKNSVFYHLLRLKQQYPQPTEGRLPESFSLGLNRKESCPTLDAIDEFVEETPLWGMPYGMPNLAEKEYQTLVTWLAQGAVAPPPSEPSSTVQPQIAAWEHFFNQTSNKKRLVSRYLYEHLFHARIHFAGSPAREFYRLVRSTTPTGERIDEIPTLRPYDDPGKASFYYRLLKYQPAIVTKNHIVYTFSNQRMARYRELFLDAEYQVAQLPSYDSKWASNPFKTFAAIPSESRYRFLLDDAHFFIEGFIKGPVCRGQIALDVIEDRFWVLFFDPNQPVITNSGEFIGEMAEELQVPADDSNLEILRIWTDYWQGQRRYMEKKEAWFKTLGSHDLEHAMDFIWDGEGENPNAALTVFRHFDSASVAYGLVGDMPETTWVIDYPLFERIHYLLVAGFDVYGSLGHRLSTRIYMDFLRMEGEDYFLAFLPAAQRKAIRDSWYVGQRSTIDELFSAPRAWLNTEVVKGYRTADPQREFYKHIKMRLKNVTRDSDNMNQCGRSACERKVESDARMKADSAMKKIAKLKGKNLSVFPDVAFVRIQLENSQQDFSYTLIRNKAYKNVTSFLADESERNRADLDEDTMTVVTWQEGAYPNFFFSVPLSDVDSFVEHCTAIRNQKDYEAFVNRYGVRRTDPKFWPMADWFQAESMQNKPITSGLFDLNRYRNF